MINRKTIACFGDSLTEGKPGVSYLDYFSQHTGLNYGVGGETTLALLERLKNPHTSASVAVLFIGTNDAYLPYLSQQNQAWSAVVDTVTARGSIPARDTHHFAQLYEACLVQLQKNYERVIVVTLPCIGEHVDSTLNQQVLRYNQKIIELSKIYGAVLIDLFHEHAALIEAPSSYLSPHPVWMVSDLIISKLRMGRTLLSRMRKLSLSVDGIHLNDRAAKRLAALIEAAIQPLE